MIEIFGKKGCGKVEALCKLSGKTPEELQSEWNECIQEGEKIRSYREWTDNLWIWWYGDIE